MRIEPVSEAALKSNIIGSQWPTLAAAMSRYQQHTAEVFVQEAYDKVMSGLIRLDDRRRLSRKAEELGIRPFDAQLLVACAIRQWAIDHQYDAKPSKEAPKLSWEHKTWRSYGLRVGIFMGTVIAIDCVVLWFWLVR